MSYHSDLELTQAALDAYLDDSLNRQHAVLKQPAMSRLAQDLHLDELIHEGGLQGPRLGAFLATYLDSTTRIQHPGNMGHQVADPHPTATIGALIDAFTNNPMAIYEMGPSAATVEFTLINWMLKIIGWSPSPYPGERSGDIVFGGGVLTHGGSLAQLTALAAARSYADPDIWEHGNNRDLVVIAPQDSHYSVSRALGILGMGQKALIEAPCNDTGHMDADLLEQTISRTLSSGKKIMAVVTNAACTAAGLYSDIRKIGEICQSHGLWLHVDGAHGASALLSHKHKHLLDGTELASSLIWDAHKMMRTPGLCAAVLFKNHEHIDRAFTQEASYLFHDKDQTGFDAISRTIECTKAGIGLKFFMGLAAQGEQGLGAYVDHCYALASDAAQLIAQHRQFELAIQPEANIVCFRLEGLSDEQQLELRKQLLASGQSYITSTMFMDRRWLRFALMNPQTTLEDIQHTLDLLTELAGKLGKEAL